MKRRWIVIGVILAVAGVAIYASRSRSNRPAAVETTVVARGQISASFTADGVVKGKSVDVAAKIAARVSAIPVREGQKVAAGETLITLDDRDLQAGRMQAAAALQAVRAGLRQAEVALTLTKQQAEAREAQAEAQLRVAQAQRAQVLAGARPQEVAQAQQQVEQARAAVAAAEGTARRARDLYARGAIARADLEQAETNLEVARAQHKAAVEALDLVRAGARPEEQAAAKALVEAAQAGVEAARSGRGEVRLREADVDIARARVAQAEAAVDAAAILVSSATLRAPFGGVVGRVAVEVGQLVSPGLPVLTLFDPTDLWVSADVADEDAARAQSATEVIVTVPAYPGRRFRAKIEELAPQAELKLDAALRTRIVRIKVRLVDGADLLRPGLEVDVEGEGTIVAAALSVPSDALLFQGNRNIVYVVENGTARLREVRVGYTTHAVAEILEGLKEGEQVVVRGKDGLTDGRRVRVVRGGGS